MTIVPGPLASVPADGMPRKYNFAADVLETDLRPDAPTSPPMWIHLAAGATASLPIGRRFYRRVIEFRIDLPKTATGKIQCFKLRAENSPTRVRRHEFADMRKSLLGRTGLEISEIALGGGVTGGILIDADEATRWAVLQQAVAGGINWIDTAPLYGNGTSEETIGRYLPVLSPRPHVSTKVRLDRDDMADIAGAIERSLEQSLERLHIERVALLQLHNQIGTAVGDRPPLSTSEVLGAVADTFDRLKEQGLIQAGGISAFGSTSACLEVIESGRFDAAQIYYNAINPSAAWSRTTTQWKSQEFCGLIAACWRLNMGMLAIRIWAGGPLASPLRPERLAMMTSHTDLDNEVRCAAAVRAALGSSYGTPAQVALRFTLGNRDLSSRVIGITELAQLDEAVAAVERGPLPPEGIAKLDQLWATDFFMQA